MKKAILRTFIEDHGCEDELVEVYDNHDFRRNSDKNAPFTLLEDQFILNPESMPVKDLVALIEQQHSQLTASRKQNEILTDTYRMVRKQNAELVGAFEKAKKNLEDGADPLEALCELMDEYDDYNETALRSAEQQTEDKL